MKPSSAGQRERGEPDEDTGGSLGPSRSMASLAEAREEGAEDDKFIAEDGNPRRYQVGPEIGAGAMGKVSLVRDRRLLRDVAWKHGDGRILREARVLAQLEHPGIVPIYDMGFDAQDRPFFAMRVVSGRSLAQILHDTPRDRRASLLRPLLRAAEAVAFAHHRGVVHRDLKPANLMIGRFGEAQVVDWGLARVLDDAEAPIPGEVRLALAGPEAGRVGTPGYMSPEQLAGLPADRRSDVYALGRVLLRIVGRRGPTPVPPELLAIGARATQADPAARYPDAGAFAADLGRYLDGSRVHAYAYRPRELLRRFAKAYRVALVIAALGLLVLGVLAVRYVADLGQARERAEGAEVDARTALARANEFLARALVGQAQRLANEGAQAEAMLLAAHALTLREDPEARAILSSFAGAPELEVLSRVALPCLEAQVDPRDGVVLCARFDGIALWRLDQGRLARAWSLAMPVQIARLVDGGVVVGSISQVTLLDRAGTLLLRTAAPNNPGQRGVVDGSLAVFEGAGIGVVADVATRAVVGVKPCDGALYAALAPREGPGGSGLAAALCQDGTLRIAGASVQTTLMAPAREGARMAPIPGGRFVVGTMKGEVLILGADGRVDASTFVVHGMVRLLEPSPDGRFVLVAGEGNPIELLTLPDLATVAALPRRAKGAVWDSSRPAELVTTGTSLERWRLRDAAPDRPLRGAFRVPLRDGVVALDAPPGLTHRLAVAVGGELAVLTPDAFARASPGFVTVKAVSLTGAELIAGGARGPGIVRLDADTLGPIERIPGLSVYRLVTLADGVSWVSLYDGLMRLDGAVLAPVAPDASLDLAASPNRRYGLMLRADDHALLRLAAGEPTTTLVGFDPRATSVAIGNDGEHFFTARDGEVAVWDELGAIVGLHRAPDAELMDVEVSGTERWIAAGARDGSVYVWRANEPAPCARFLDQDERVTGLAFGADERWLASGSWDRTLRVRDLAVIDEPAEIARAAIARRFGLDLDAVLRGSVPGGTR